MNGGLKKASACVNVQLLLVETCPCPCRCCGPWQRGTAPEGTAAETATSLGHGMAQPPAPRGAGLPQLPAGCAGKVVKLFLYF